MRSDHRATVRYNNLTDSGMIKQKGERMREQERMTRGLPERSHVQTPTELLFVATTGTQEQAIPRQ